MACTYVKEFDFGTKDKSGSVKYAMGGGVKADMKQDKTMVKAAVHKHEKALHKGEPLTKLAKGGKVQAPGFIGQTMIKDTSKLGIKDNKNPGVNRSKPVAPNLPTMKLAKGGAVIERGTGERYPSRRSMMKHESMETPAMQKSEVTQRELVRPGLPTPDVIRNPGMGRKSVPVASSQPLVALKKGGGVSQAKVGKVMGEFKAGDLHSGKKGPVVTKPKQAIAIALSEGRKASKR